MKKFILILIIGCFLNPFSLFSQDKNEFIFLLDNSGSMSGYYREANSAFKVFCKAVIKNSVKPNDNANVYLFTKTDAKRGLTSPKNIFSGSGKNLIPDQLNDKLTMMRANDGGFGTTDLIEALDKSIANIKGETAIIWLITDNINDNSGSGDSSYFNTLEYYKRLRNDDNIKKVLLYPIPEKIVEAGYQSNGYVVYGIVYSKKNIDQTMLEGYDKILRGIGIKQRPITLKPLDIGTIVLNPKVTQSKIVPGKLFYDGKVLRGFDFQESEKIKETFSDLSLKSNLFPYIIKSAKLDVKLDNFKSSDYSVKTLGTQTITPSTVSNVSPEGEVKGFSVQFDMPEISPKFSFNTIFKEDFTVGGNLVLEVTNVDILLDENYVNSFKELFALQTIPEIFKPVLKDKKILTYIPLEIRIKYGAWRLFALIGMILLLLVILFIPAYLFLKKKCFAISVNGRDDQSVCINSLNSYDVYSDDSQNLGAIKKSISGALSFTCSKFTVTPSKTINLIEGIPVSVEIEDENYRKSSYIIMLKKSDNIPESEESDLSKYH
jgi:hypothetical protein